MAVRCFTIVHMVVLITGLLCKRSFGDDKTPSEDPSAWRNGWDLLQPEKNPVWRDPPAILLPRPGANNPKPDLEKLWQNTNRINFVFDPKYMSNTNPLETNTTTSKRDVLSRRTLMLSMPSDLKTLHFPVPGSDRELGVRASKKLRLWLWNMALCPVLPLWKDYGPTRWPRYINVGECSKKATCSYPKGMRCKRSKMKKVDTFFWFCNEKLRGKCMWVKYEEQVVEECQCGCSNYDKK